MHKPRVTPSSRRRRAAPPSMKIPQQEKEKEDAVAVPSSVVFSFETSQWSRNSDLFQVSTPVDFGFPSFVQIQSKQVQEATSLVQTGFPVEIVQHVFRYLPLNELFLMRSLCRHINACLLDPHFALVVLKHELEVECLYDDEDLRVEIGTLEDQDSLTDLDRLWFKMPEPYASIYARLRLLTVKSFCLVNEMIEGAIPPQIAQLPLHTLVISDSMLTGRLPSTLGHLRFLKRLSLENNAIKGRIPRELGQLGLLKVLNLSENSFTGPIPEDWYNLRSLQRLDLSSNSLSGPLPASLGSLKSLISLNLSKNRLTGILPDLTDLPRLDVLDLGENRFMSPLPELPASLQEIRLNNNSFSGPIPLHLTKLPKLHTLSLSHNHFTLTIPPGFGKLKRLLVLDLSHNQLIGSIPPFIESLFLTEVDLSANHLSTGIIPDLDKLGVLESISVSLTQSDKDEDGVYVTRLLVCDDCGERTGCNRQMGRLSRGDREWEFLVLYRQRYLGVVEGSVSLTDFRSGVEGLRGKWLTERKVELVEEVDVKENDGMKIVRVMDFWRTVFVSSLMVWGVVFGGWTWVLLSVVIQW
ncbi:UNVERIFIED_CONTAM: hypothetical protein HDU68_009946 [Siphonaria sp. JEL0065]|nr:hypothetical protein HDU68_009946 [Siphonaria sp. JEL0065]